MEEVKSEGPEQDSSKDLSQKPPKDEKVRKSNSSMLILFCLSLSIGSGILSGWWFGARSPDKREVAVLDVTSIVEAKKKEFIKKFEGKEISPATKTEMEKEISLFTERLNRIIEGEGRNKVIFAKDSVLSEERDITDEVAKKVNNEGR